ncbi:AAA family ATPase [Klebsiella oxytoca]|uniref:AAA family ATPase n=1 Tax=Klebsiella oxytoca TaxID=571 RepID=UPI0020C2FDA2|nr:AAA family ATPase [Klebsiella oxytoca]
MTAINRIHIFGASGSGTTSIAKKLAERVKYSHFDTDDYYWRNTSPPYTVKYESVERKRRLSRSLTSCPQWILSGSLCGWGDIFVPLFDLVVYVSVDKDTRLERIRQRELLRFGDAILAGGEQYDRYCAFMAWAGAYDTSPDITRSAERHRQWLANLTTPRLVITNDKTIDEAVNIIFSGLL